MYPPADHLIITGNVINSIVPIKLNTAENLVFNSRKKPITPKKIIIASTAKIVLSDDDLVSLNGMEVSNDITGGLSSSVYSKLLFAKYAAFDKKAKLSQPGP